jgi:hypothetical protein
MMETETIERTRIAGPQVGDVLVSSWGYDQTNVDFYRVVSLTASGKSVRIVPVAQRVHSYSKGCEHVVPGEGVQRLRGDQGPTTRLVRWYGHGDRLAWCVGVPTGHRATARLWGGQPVFQTAAGWGH